MKKTTRAVRALALAIGLGLGFSPQVVADDIDFGFVTAPGPGEAPALLVTPNRTVKALHVEIVAGGKTYTFDKSNLPGGKVVRLSFARDPKVTSAEAFVRAEFTDGFVCRKEPDCVRLFELGFSIKGFLDVSLHLFLFSS